MTEERKVEEKVEEVTPKKIGELIEKATPKEWRYLLRLELRRRISGCGWKYRYGYSLETLYGAVEKITLSRTEHNCDITEEVLLIPRTIPVVVRVYEWDENPEVKDTVTFWVFTVEGWKSTETEVPK